MSTIPVGDARRNDSQLPLGVCPMCTNFFPIDGRGLYCTPRCCQRAYRLRRRQIEPTDADRPSTRLRREQRLIDQTVYECSSCQERFLGERRCDGCNLWCRKLGLGGRCSGCDDVLTLSELLGFDLNSKEVTPSLIP